MPGQLYEIDPYYGSIASIELAPQGVDAKQADWLAISGL